MNISIVRKVVSTDAGFSALTLKLPIAIIFIAHGAQKLFGIFGSAGNVLES